MVRRCSLVVIVAVACGQSEVYGEGHALNRWIEVPFFFGGRVLFFCSWCAFFFLFPTYLLEIFKYFCYYQWERTKKVDVTMCLFIIRYVFFRLVSKSDELSLFLLENLRKFD